MGIVYLITNKINNRKYIGVDTNNNKNYFGSGKSIKLALKKYGRENFIKEVIEENDNNEFLFQREKYYIELYDAVKSSEYYNMAEGGKGGSGTLASEESKELHRLGCKKAGEIMILKRKGKTYEEIYGDNSDIEKEKRRIAGLGKKYSAERIKHCSDGLKGKLAWNKGLKTGIEPWNKGKKCYHKKYILTLLDKQELTFFGRDNLKEYIKNINCSGINTRAININNLINNEFDNDYILNVIKLDKPIIL